MFFFSSRSRHTRCALVTGVQTCALPILLSAVGLYGLLPRFGDFADSWQILREANLWFVTFAACASLLSVVCSAVIYTILAPRRLHVGNTLLVQLPGLLVNRVLPAGIGGLGLNYLYLRARRHTIAQATARPEERRVGKEGSR